MHLRRNRNQDQQQAPRERREFVPEVKKEEKETVNWNRLSFPKEIRDLAGERKVLLKKIHEIENRLRFGYSAPLYNYKMELVKEDLELSCKMTDHLVTLKGKGE